MAWGWTGVWKLGGKQRGKMGIQLKGKKACPQSKRGGGWEGQRHEHGGERGSWAPFPGPCVPWGSFPSGSLLAGLG